MAQLASKRAVGVDYIAGKIGYDPSTIHRWRKAGYLPKENPPDPRARGGRVLWPKSVIDEWIAEKFEV